ncbi:MAG TPA: class I SAM-dependent methyltransferase [Pseudomonadota bacterium]|nr:class I SAM-dependent methyltransferase [Pseudomonadota bacterium]
MDFRSVLHKAFHGVSGPFSAPVCSESPTQEPPQGQTELQKASLHSQRDPRLLGVPLCGSFSLVMNELANKKVCDLGCNAGHYLQFSGVGSVGVDCNAVSVLACRKLGFETLQHDLNCLPLPLPDASFQVVLLSHVLEHVTTPLHLLREANRILQNKGKLVIGLPIEDSLYARLRMDYFGGTEGHLYSFSLANLRKLLHLSGFFVDRFVFHVPRLGNRISRWNERLSDWFGESLYPFSGAYFCVAEKAGTPTPFCQISNYFSGNCSGHFSGLA